MSLANVITETIIGEESKIDLKTSLSDTPLNELIESFNLLSSNKSWNLILAENYYNELYARALTATFLVNIQYDSVDEWINNPKPHGQVGFRDNYVLIDNNGVPMSLNYKETNVFMITTNSFLPEYDAVETFLKDEPAIIVSITDEIKISKLTDIKNSINNLDSGLEVVNVEESDDRMLIKLEMIYDGDFLIIKQMFDNLSKYISNQYNNNVEDEEEESG